MTKNAADFEGDYIHKISDGSIDIEGNKEETTINTNPWIGPRSCIIRLPTTVYD